MPTYARLSMEELFRQIAEHIASVPAVWGYSIILLFTWLENIVPPIPGDMIVVFGGYVAVTGSLNLVLLVAISTIGAASGFMCMYWLGRTAGIAVLQSRYLQWIPEDPVERTTRWMARWGLALIVINRFLAIARAVISLMAGITRLPAAGVAVCSAISALLWTTLLALLGYFIGTEWERILGLLGQYSRAVSAVLLLWVVWQVVKVVRRHLRGSSANHTTDTQN